MTTIQVKSWSPSNGSFTRFYVTNADTNEQIGFIQTRERFIERDVTAGQIDRIEGDEAIMAAVVAIAAADRSDDMSLSLYRMTVNQPLPYGIPKAAKAKKTAEIKARKFNV